MAERDVVASFSGQIFEAAASTKKWTSIASGPATVQIVNLDEQGHQIIALDKDREVLVHDINNEMQLRSKDNFVQWRKTNSAGRPVNYGLRLKSANDSQRFEAIVGGVLAMLETTPSATPTKTPAASKAPAPGNPAPYKPPTTTTTTTQAENEVKERDMLLKVHLPGKQTTVISVPPNITMEGLLSNIVTKRHLDPRYHELVLPPSKPKTAQTQFSPSTQLHTLRITEVHIVKRTKPLADKKQAPGLPPEQRKSVPSMEPRGSIPSTEQNKPVIPTNQKITAQLTTQTQKQAQMTILKVQLPYDQRTVVQVSPSMTMPQLLVYICEKRNLNPAHHTLTLPSPSSGQIRIVTREMTVSAITSGVITLIDLKAHRLSIPSSAMPEAKISGKKGSFSPNETKPVDKTAQKRSAPPPPANEGKRKVSQDLVQSLEKKITDKSGDKEGKQNLTPAGDKDSHPSPAKNVARRRAPPPPKIKKEAIDETDFGPEASVSPGTPKHLTTQTKQPIPGSPAKRPAPGIPTAAKQHVVNSQFPTSTGKQPPTSPTKQSTEDTSDQTTAKKRRQAPTRPPPQRKLETELQQETPMDTTAPNQDVLELKKTARQGRPMSASSAQYKLEVDELEECLSGVVEEAERHLQDETFKEDTDTKQDSSVDETDSGHAPMETDSVNKVTSDDKTDDDATSKAEQNPSQVVSESGTVRGIKGRVREQIAASNQSEIMLHGFMKKQKSFTRTPLAVVHKSESNDQPTMNKRASLIRTGSHEDLSTQEPKQVFKRSNSQRIKTTKQDESPEERKLKPRGRAPPPPQDKMKQKQLQQGVVEDKAKVTTTQFTEVTPKQTEQPPTPASQLHSDPARERAASGGPEIVRKVPPKVKPKMTRVKSKEAEDKVTSSNTPVTTADTVTQSVKSHPAALSKRTKSESYIKAVSKQIPPNKERKSSAATIESSNDGRQVLVLCPSPPPGSSKQDQPTSAVRIFLPPPPPILPPCEEQEGEENTELTTSPEKNKTATSVTATQDQQLVGTDGHMTNDTSKHSLEGQQPSVGNKQDSSQQVIEPLPHVVFNPKEDLPPTPPGTPHNELVSGETMISGKDEEIVAPGNEEIIAPDNDEEILVPDNDDIETVPPPPPMDDFSIDEDSLPPPVDFDPSLLPPPLPGDDDEFDEAYIVPPPPSAEDDNIITTLMDMAPSFEAAEEDTLMSDDVPPESTPPWTPPISNKEPMDFEGDIDIPSIPDSLPAEELETKEDNAMETEKVKMTENITETSGDIASDISEPPVESTKESETQDELSNIIASLQTMLQDQAESDGEEVVDDSLIQTPPLSAWRQPPESPPKESLPNESKNEMITQDAVTTQDVTTTQAVTTQDVATTQAVTTQDVATTQAVTTQDVATTQAVTTQDVATTQAVTTQDVATTQAVITQDVATTQAVITQDVATTQAVTTQAVTTQDVATTQAVITQDVATIQAVTTQDVATTQAVTTQDVATTQAVTTQDVATTQAVTTQDSANKQMPDHSKISSTAEAVKQETVAPNPVPVPVRAAPPPPPLPPVGKPKLPTSPTKAKSPPPTVKPKPKRPGSTVPVEEFQDELAAKLKRRQTKDQGWEGNTSQAAATIKATQPSVTQPKRITRPLSSIQTNVPKGQNNMQSTQSRVPNVQATPVPPVQGAVPSMSMQNAMGAGNVSGSQEEQIQMLQNQIQILQLQQQLQQLQQQQVAPGQTPNPMMAMPQLGVPGMQMPAGMQMPQIGMAMQIPQSGTGMQQGGTPLPTQMISPLVGTSKPPIPSNATNTPVTTNNTSTDSETRSESPPPLPSTSPPPLPTTSPPPLTDPNSPLDQLTYKTMNKTVSDSVLHQRPPSQALRSKAAGEYEDALDDILEEVREADHSTILRKPLPPPEQTGSPHTEMASLLAQAMKQRRINITSKRHSTSMEDEQDTSHEWD